MGLDLRGAAATAACLLVLASVLLPMPDALAGTKRGAAVVVATDPMGDWGCNVDCSLAQIGHELGQELLEASLQMADQRTLHFVLRVADLPSIGGVPEGTRYIWDFTVDGRPLQLTGAFSEYLRGTCNPIHQNCPPPRDPGPAPFFIRAPAPSIAGVVFPVEELALVHATFDPETDTITIPVPLAAIGARRGSVIGTSRSDNISAAPAAYITITQVQDSMTTTNSFEVPR